MKKSLSIIMVLAMVLTLIPSGIIMSSAATSGDYTYTVTGSNAAIIKYNGTASVITIPGELDGYTVTEISRLAFYESTVVTSVKIPDSVTFIGDNAFYGCKILTSVTIGNGVITIDDYAFTSCHYLNSLTLGNSVTTIGYGTFSNCDKLTSVNIPNSVTTIENGGFSNCVLLNSVTFTDSVISVGSGVFDYTAWYNNRPDGLVYVGRAAYKYKGTMAANTSITFDPDTKSISSKAFNTCTGLSTVNIPYGVNEIGKMAFNGCTSLTAAFFYGNAPKTVGSNIFSNCATGFTIYYLNGKTDFTNPWNGYTTEIFGTLGNVTIIFDANGGSGSTSASITPGDPLSVPTVTKTGCSFTGWSPSVPLTAPAEDTTYTAEWSTNCYTIAFDANGGTGSTSTSMSFGESLSAPAVAREGYTLAGWSPAIPATVPAENAIYTAQWTPGTSTILTSGDYVYTVADSKATIVKYNGFASVVAIPCELDGYPVTAISHLAFYQNTAINSVAIPDSVTFIGDNAFYGCLVLTSVTIGNGVKTIDDYAFTNCKYLTSVTIGNSVSTIGYCAFSNCYKLTSVNIPNSVTKIENGGFASCTSLSSVTFTDSVISVGLSVFDNTVWFTNQPDGLVYVGRAAYKYKGTMAPNTSITLDSDTTCITERAFYKCTGLSSVYIQNGVNEIGRLAFSGCTSLTAAYFYGNAPKTVGEKIFDSCAFGFTVYYLSGKSDFTNPWYGYPTETFVILGDVNGDGNVDSIDAGVIVDFENKSIVLDKLAEATFYAAGDANGDLNVDSLDAGIIIDFENKITSNNLSKLRIVD